MKRLVFLGILLYTLHPSGTLVFGQNCQPTPAPCPSPSPCSGPLSVCGQWEAISQCAHPDANEPCTPPKDKWPRVQKLMGTHSTLVRDPATGEPRVVAWLATVGKSGYYAYYWDPALQGNPPYSQMISSDPNGPFPLGIEELFCSGHVVLSDGRVLIVGGTDRSRDDHIDQDPSNNWIAGINTAYIFDPTTPATPWSRKEQMSANYGPGWRWYPTATVLEDGRVMAFGGKTTDNPSIGLPPLSTDRHARVPEIYELDVGWTSLSTPQATAAANDSMTMYPYMHVLPGPNTSVLHAGPRFGFGDDTTSRSGAMQVLEFEPPPQPLYSSGGTGGSVHATWTNFVSTTSPEAKFAPGTSAMFEVTRTSVKILNAGGFYSWAPESSVFPVESRSDLDGPPTTVRLASDSAEVIDFNPQTLTVSRIPTQNKMHARRFSHNLTVLPDGKVLVVGGGTRVRQSTSKCDNAVYNTDVYDPTTDQFTEAAPMCGFRASAPNLPYNHDEPRMYHSTAILLPDGRVLSAGGECSKCCNRTVNDAPVFEDRGCFGADFFKPGYLFSGNSEITDYDHRPSVANPPSHIGYGEALSLDLDTNPGTTVGVTQVALLRPGSTTHTNNMEQRRVPLDCGSTPCPDPLVVAAQDMPDARMAPPGYYMLFMINALGHPSRADFVNVWGVIETSVADLVTQECKPQGGSPNLTFNVSWTTTIKSTGVDTLQIYSPGGTCGNGTGLVVTATPPGGGSLTHQISKTVACQTGTWKYIVKSSTNGSTSTSICRSVYVSCITCNQCPPSGCEIE